ncbi:MAG TPA: hypothetical protein VGK93_00410, partial [Candidatus Eisenbacteria bacterium]
MDLRARQALGLRSRVVGAALAGAVVGEWWRGFACGANSWRGRFYASTPVETLAGCAKGPD